MLINIIVAVDKKGGISKNGYIPWYCKADIKRFSEITTTTIDEKKRNAVVMGRKTFETIGKELPKRVNYILSNSISNIEGMTSFSLEEEKPLQSLFETISRDKTIEKIFIIGGETIYNLVVKEWLHIVDKIYVTHLDIDAGCTQFFPVSVLKEHCILRYEHQVTDSGLSVTFREYTPINFAEKSYLDLLESTLKQGDNRVERTGVGTISQFGVRMEFDNIQERFPLLTTKKVPWKTILRELLWFISGSTDATVLQIQGVRIWDGNTTRAFLDSRGLNHLPEGDIGEGYGFNWRHFGAKYSNCKADYTNQGTDQLAEIVRLIKEEPTSRRILLSAWNPATLHKAALPPCHVLCQFYVRNGYLDCQMYQRSGDLALGVPFNIASYAALTLMIARVCGLKGGKFIHVIGDAHVYKNHIEGVKQQLLKEPYPFPKLEIAERTSLFDFCEGDFNLIGYKSHPTIQLEMAV